MRKYLVAAICLSAVVLASAIPGEPARHPIAKARAGGLMPAPYVNGPIALSHTGKFLAGVVADGIPLARCVAHVWDMATGKETATFPGLRSDYGQLAFSADEKSLTAVTPGPRDPDEAGFSVCRWNLETKKETAYFVLGSGGALRAVSPNGKYMATVKGYPNDTAVIYDLEKKAEEIKIKIESRHVSAVAFDRVGKYVVLAGDDETIAIWDLLTGEPAGKLKAERLGNLGSSPSFQFLEFSPDGKTLAAYNGRQVVRLWNVADGKLIAAQQGITGRQCRFTPDGRYLITIGREGIQFRSTKDLKIASKLEVEVPIDRMAISGDGRTLALGSGRVRIFEITQP
jgi:WD40 repeat protein